MKSCLPFVCVAIAAMLAACAPAVSQKSDVAAGTATTQGGDGKAGAIAFAQNCASCHGAAGKEGGAIGPSLRNESQRMDFDTAVSWIEDPAPPMPKLYPKYLTEHQVRDLAAYVESL